MKWSFGKIRSSIRLTVVTVCMIATVLTAGVAIGLQYYFGQAMAREAASDLYTTVSTSIAAKLRNVGRINGNVIHLLADNPALRDPATEQKQLEIFTGVLARNPLYYGVYLGRSDGSLFEVINLDTSAQARRDLQTQPGDRWLVMSVEPGRDGWERRYRYLDADLSTRLTRSEPTDYRVSSRTWYTSAIDSGEVQVSDPYLFAQLGVPGRTISRRVTGTDTVVAIDMTLSTISEFLAEQKITRHSALYLYDGDGRIIASSQDPMEGSGTEGTGPAEVPCSLLLDMARNPQLREQVLETQLANGPHLVYSAATTALDQKPLYVGILTPVDTFVAPFLDKVKLSILVTTGLLLLLLPMSWVIANPIVRPVRQLASENDKVRRREYQQVARVKTQVKELHELSDSMVDMVAAIQAHELAQRKLMDAIIELIAEAIDDKSAYTGGHCERVPELALMLARHASSSDEPAFRGFHLETDDEWREYRIAAWLHDCGKITMPEHIVDKGSKLEVIYNRIHEIRMRFEVLWRDAEIEYLKSLQESPQEKRLLHSTLREKRRRLVEDFEFVAECNVGGESLDREKLDRLHNLARVTWERHFDNRIGLSPVEELRITGTAPELPVTEQLLDDKPEHVIERTRSTDYPPSMGIDMDIPEKLSNQGEIYNLSVSRGTLTDEDRFRINEHMISTIKMLESLPFPQELKNVPRYASTHHETMKGSGYPRRLPGHKLTIPERLLAIADIFEALTASDRPYKKAKSVGAAIEILNKMVLDNHVDRDCFELFLREGVYLEYAHKFLATEQIDEVDIARYLDTEAAPAA